jgi:lipoprotein NlpD
MGAILLRAGLACLLVVLSGCPSHGRAPIVQKGALPESRPSSDAERSRRMQPAQRSPAPTSHRVTRGDTLHAIAWRYRLDYRDLIRWNKMRNPDLIMAGQTLRLTPPSRQVAKPATAPTSPAPTRPKAAANVRVKKPSTPLQWQWPANGNIKLERSVSGSQGIEIRGALGQAVNAATGGVVVYSGSGLRGYGELIIIKHNETFLSAYAHNKARLVEEGQRVQAGQMIARMGDSEARDVMLHFEIRRNGKTVDPFQYLPKR